MRWVVTAALCGVAVLATGGCGGSGSSGGHADGGPGTSGLEVDIRVLNNTSLQNPLEVWIDGTRTTRATATFPDYAKAEKQPFSVELRQNGQLVASAKLGVDDAGCTTDCQLAPSDLYRIELDVCADPSDKLLPSTTTCAGHTETCVGDGACAEPAPPDAQTALR